MTASPETDPTSTLSGLQSDDVQIIRQILFGEQLKGVLTRLETLEKSLTNLRGDLKDETKARQEASRSGGQQLAEQMQQLQAEIAGLRDSLQTDLKAESQERKAAQERLGQDLHSEQKALQTALIAEQQTRQEAVSSLQSGLASEQESRQQVLAELDRRLKKEQQANQESHEQLARQAKQAAADLSGAMQAGFAAQQGWSADLARELAALLTRYADLLPPAKK
ncbi:MAG: hypothetical protein JXB15_02250 [Anaerolineales bacterium]|nr:hypothetical protein [Anaerolineales bacterium]